MCFSAQASLASGAALIPAGGYCLWSAARKRPAALPLAAVPLLFGLQQVSEGVVWLALDRGDAPLTRSASLVFLFFALGFWPFWLPFLTTVAETKPARRRALAALTALSAAWFWVLYWPLLTGPEWLLSTRVVGHSIQYAYPDLGVYRHVPRPLLRVLYFVSVALPLALGSEPWGRLPGLVLACSAVAAALLFEHAFVSVWCFFAAALSAYLCYVFRAMPEPGGPPTAQFGES
jgi:hypothetical protein